MLWIIIGILFLPLWFWSAGIVGAIVYNILWSFFGYDLANQMWVQELSCVIGATWPFWIGAIFQVIARIVKKKDN